MQLRVLGPLEVTDDGGQVVPVAGAKERAVLAVLLVHLGGVVSTDRLLEAVWGDDLPANPANTLQHCVSQLRRALPDPTVLVTRRPGYLLDVHPERVDAYRFERLHAQARQVAQKDPATAADLLTAALALWRGPALADFAYEDFAQGEAVRLEELRLQVLEDMDEAKLALGRHAELIGELEALVAARPLRERPRRQLMLALYRSGRQADALQVYEQTRSVLAEQLGVDPGRELQDLHQAILRQDADLEAALQEPAAPDHNLPARITGLIGRRAERAQVAALLESARLVTVTGPGGVGKTSLALQVAADALAGYRDGAWLVELASLPDGELVPAAVAGALGLHAGPPFGGDLEQSPPPLQQLADHLRTRRLLLIFDNCEHLVRACTRLAAQLLAVAPELRVIATSREALGMPAEALFVAPPLRLPPERVTPETLADYDAARLFLERVRAVRPGLGLDGATARAVARICRRLDGLPLAIELAAARARVLSPQELAVLLDDRLRLLVGSGGAANPRQQTLRATIDWSYDLLADTERLLLHRLAVFAGGCTLEAAEEVCAGDGVQREEVLDLLARLVDQSLLAAEPGEPTRFQLLQTIRQYASERLAASGELQQVGRCHATYYLHLAERAGSQRTTPAWIERLEAEHDNLRAAIDWSLTSGDQETAVRLAGLLGWFWFLGHQEEGRRWLSRVLADGVGASADARARALQAAALIEAFYPTKQSMAAARESLALFEQLGDRGAAATSKVLVVLELALHGQLEQARSTLDDAADIFDELGDQWGEALAGLVRLELELHVGELDRAAAVGQRALERFRELGDQWGEAATLWHLGIATRLLGDLQAADRYYQRAVAIAHQLRQPYVEVSALVELGNLAALTGDQQRAGQLHQQALTIAHDLGSPGALAAVWNGMGVAARGRGDYRQAREWHLRALAVYRDLAFPSRLAFTLSCLGFAEELIGDLHDAQAHHLQALSVATQATHPQEMALATEGLGCIAARQGDAERAAMLVGVATRLRDTAGSRPATAERADVDRATRIAVAAIGQDRFDALVAHGRQLPDRDAMALADR